MAKNRVINFIWPEITDIRTAKDAAWYGLLASGFWAVICGFIALLALLLTLLGAGGARESGKGFILIFASLLGFVINGIVAWAIYKKLSRFAAVASLCLTFKAWVTLWVKSIAAYGLKATLIFQLIHMVLTLMFINAMRGTFAFHKFSRSQVASAVEPDSPEKNS